MKVILALLALCMIAPCLGEPHTVTTGSYTISFDLGIPEESYSVEVPIQRQASPWQETQAQNTRSKL
jgi:hypothetical protein